VKHSPSSGRSLSYRDPPFWSASASHSQTIESVPEQFQSDLVPGISGVRSCARRVSVLALRSSAETTRIACRRWPRRLQLSPYKRPIEDGFGPVVADLALPLHLDLAPHRFKSSLNPVNTHRQGVDQIEALGVLGQDRREHALDKVAKSPEIMMAMDGGEPPTPFGVSYVATIPCRVLYSGIDWIEDL